MSPADSLAGGAAGVALLHLERARTGSATWADAHAWAGAITRDPVTAHPDVAGLFRGAPAVAFTLHTAGQAAYAKVLDTLDGAIATLTREQLRRAHDRIDRGQLPRLREFDLISGLTGLGAYLLHRDRAPDLLSEVLAYLVRLTEPVSDSGDTVPGWWCAEHPLDQPADRWPGGHGNLGMAHGVAGPLALLATALVRGRSVPGQADAVAIICRWLDRWRGGSPPRVWWPGRITRAELHTGAATHSGPQRPSWCYGTPGLARALQLAALAIGDTYRQQQVEQALAWCVTDEQQLDQLIDATVCHGWAGLVLATWRCAVDARDSDALLAALPRLRSRLEDQLRRDGPPAAPGLLDGAAGVELAHRLPQATETRWDACLLLSG